MYIDPTGEVAGADDAAILSALAVFLIGVFVVALCVGVFHILDGLINHSGVNWDRVGWEMGNVFTSAWAWVTGLFAADVIIKAATIEPLPNVYFADIGGKVTPPSWVNRGMVKSGLSPSQNADNIMNNRYGKGNWKKGPGEEHNIIKKWIEYITGGRGGIGGGSTLA